MGDSSVAAPSKAGATNGAFEASWLPQMVVSMKHGIRIDRVKGHIVVKVDGWGPKDEWVVHSCNVTKPELDSNWPKNVKDAVHKRLSGGGGHAEGRILSLYRLYLKGEASLMAVLLYHLESGDLVLITRIGTASGVDRSFFSTVAAILVRCAKAVAREIDPKAQVIRWRVYTQDEEKFARSLGFTKVIGRGNDRKGRVLEAAI